VGAETELQAFSPAATCPWTPAAAGAYTLRVEAREVGTLTTTATTTLPYAIVPALRGVTVTTSPRSPGLAQTAVTVTATPAGGAVPEYRVYVQRTDLLAQPSVAVRGYATSPTCAWTPAGVGTYKLLVLAREVGNPAAYEVYGATTFTVAAPVTAVALTVNPTLQPQPTGTPLTLTATATGGAQLEYQFQAGRPDAAGVVQYTEVRGYAASKSCTWTPTTAGAYTLRVHVREAGATAVAAMRTTDYTIVPAVAAVALTASPASRGLVGARVRLTATPTAGVNVAYRFYVQRTDLAAQPQVELRGYAATASCDWTPTAVGRYKLLVLAREAGLTVAYQAYATLSYTVVAPLATVTFGVSPAGPRPVGTRVTLTAGSTDGVTPQYQFLLGLTDVLGVTTWQELQAYSGTASCGWTAPAVGSYTLRLRARDAADPTAVTTREAAYVVSNALTGLAVSVTPAAPRTPGTRLTVTATPTGGTAPQVAFRLGVAGPSGLTWTTLQAFGPATTASWTPAAAGTYTVEASVREGATGAAAVTRTVDVVVTPAVTGLTLSCAPTAPAVGGTATLTARATGGGTLHYRFTSQRTDVASAPYVELQAYGPAASCPWTPPAAGRYKLLVTVREAGDPSPYTAYATTTATVP
jgi:hypothetical protein